MVTVKPREASTVILLREASPFEILMVARNPSGRVMSGVWVFPGGGVERQDGHGEDRLRAAAVRELAEETAIVGLDPADLVAFSRWIAPKSLPVRFDTHFFLARAPVGQEPAVDGVEIVDAGWFAPARALALEQEGRLPMLFPTRKQVERLAGHDSIDALLAAAAESPVTSVRPRLRIPGNRDEVLLPGDEGYDTAIG